MRKKFLVSILLAVVMMSMIAFSDENIPEKNKVICIDPGHQLKGNSEKEPIGPGATVSKPKVSSGTRGISTKKYEYELTLEIALLLKEKLEERGYTVVLTRDKHDVNISNKERAQIANEAGADLFLRIHADGIDNTNVHGLSALYPSEKNPYIAHLSKDSKKISSLLIAEMAKFTGATNRGIFQRDDLTGTNWSKMPTALVEVGFMSNAAEDQKMATKDYQAKLVRGMVNAIELYFMQKK